MRLGTLAGSPPRGRVTTLRASASPGEGGGAWSPSGSTYDDLLTLPGTTIAYRFDGASLRQTISGADGVAADQPIGWAHDWLDEGEAATAATAADAIRPVLGALAGVICALFDGDQTINGNQRLNLPHITSPTGTFVLAARLRSVANSAQTLLQTQLFRVMARFSGFAGPTIRVADGQQVAFGLASMLDRWTCLVGRWNTALGLCHLWHDGSGSWVEIDLGDLGWTWLADSPSMLNRNIFEGTNGAPANAGHRALVINDRWDLSQAEIQKAVAFAVEGTGISAVVPALPSAAPDPENETIPAAANIVDVATTGELAAAIAAWEEGDHIRLTANCALPSTISAIRAATKLAQQATGNTTITGANVWLWGLVLTGDVTNDGDNNRVLRCRFPAGQTVVPRASLDMVIAYCDWPAIGGNRAIDGQPRNGMRRTTVKACLFKGWTGYSGAALVPVRHGASSPENDIDMASLFDTCLFDGDNQVAANGSEWALEIKGSGIHIRRVSVINCRAGKGRIGIRHGHNGLIEVCNTERGITLFHGRLATPHTVYNNIAEEFRLFAGTVNGETIPFGGAGSNYPPVANLWMLYNTGPAINGYMYSSEVPPPFNAVNTRFRGHSGSIENRHQTGVTTTGSSPLPMPTTAPTKVTAAEVGPNAPGGYNL
jgi:hypothetical protein